jgi:antitoxin component of RelBE/YafQ-DinJ toxin-antitoxin module
MSQFKSITARIDSSSLTYLNRISKMYNIDKSAAFRLVIKKGIDVDKKEKALEQYIKGDASIEKAADFAGMYIGDFYEYMRSKGIESNVTLEDVKDSLKNLRDR